MPFKKFDRSKVKMLPLSERENKQVFADKLIQPSAKSNLDEKSQPLLDEIASRIKVLKLLISQ